MSVGLAIFLLFCILQTTAAALQDPTPADAGSNSDPPLHVNIATQCASLSLLGLSSSDLWLFHNLQSLQQCKFKDAVQIAPAGSGSIVIGGSARTTTSAYGSRIDGHCEGMGLRFAVKVNPDYVAKWVNRSCSVAEDTAGGSK